MNFVPLLTGVLMASGLIGGSYVQPTTPLKHQSYASVSAGLFDALPHTNKKNEDKSADLRGEYRFGTPLYSRGIAAVYPFVGAEMTTDGSFYGLGGVAADVQYGSVYMTPTFGAGLYSSGEGKFMGSPIEFRTGVEVGYEFKSEDRLGVSLTHISNAEIGKHNPGAEIIGVYYHYPVNW